MQIDIFLAIKLGLDVAMATHNNSDNHQWWQRKRFVETNERAHTTGAI